jgi:hypothetical protein
MILREWDRKKIDPEGKYTNKGNHGEYPRYNFTRMEKMALRTIELFPFSYQHTRTRDVFEMHLRDNSRDSSIPHWLCGLTLLITAEALELRIPFVDWVGHHEPTMSSRFWKRVAWEELATDNDLKAVVTEGMKIRRDECRPCKYCKRIMVPEHLYNEGTCAGCAYKHLGIIS